jgi:hypothetical protein
MLGAPGDIQAMAQWAGNKLAPLLAKQPGGDLIGAVMGMAQGRSGPTTEELGAVLGADPNSPEFQVASFGAPDMSDVGRIGLAQALFHGTPHRFDKFDISKIGTGEGDQAFGHGLYFAENPGVARSYRNVGEYGRTAAKDVAWWDMDIADADFLDKKLAGIVNNSDDAETVAIRAEQLQERFGISRKDVDRLAKDYKEKVQGHLYEVDISDDVVNQMLDWDAPLSEQPESVRKALEHMGFHPSMSGKEMYKKIAGMEYSQVVDNLVPEGLYDDLLDSVGGDKALADKLFNKHKLDLQSDALEGLNSEELASRALNQAGIPGIRFYDGGSRGVAGGKILDVSKDGGRWKATISNPGPQRFGVGGGNMSRYFDTEDAAKAWAESETKGTRNIVVFDPDSTIRKVKRDGKLVHERDGKLVHENTDLAKALRDGK